ncbi:MAG TPA: sigma-70 family RNA polymerase sigma factor [Armatimonadota bacterium]|jgi:RNA polymerase sigma-70 factor (ECF subfamily)
MIFQAPDEVLARRAAEGEQSCFEKLIARHRDRVYRICYRCAGNSEDAEDWAQECFIRGYTQLGYYDASRPFAPWFYRVVSNVCINLAHSRNRWRATVDLGLPDDGGEVAAEGTDPAAAILSIETRRAVLEAVESLDPKLRQVVILRVLDGMSFKELGETFGVPLATTSTWLRRALVQVRQQLARKGVGIG